MELHEKIEFLRGLENETKSKMKALEINEYGKIPFKSFIEKYKRLSQGLDFLLAELEEIEKQA